MSRPGDEGLRRWLVGINPTMAESPEGLDWQRLRSKAVQLTDKLSHSFGATFALSHPSHIQDSTHCDEISLPETILIDKTIVRPVVRISNWENLVLVTCSRKVEPAALARIEEIAQECGFKFIPEAVFGEPFDVRQRMNGDVFNQLFDYT